MIDFFFFFSKNILRRIVAGDICRTGAMGRHVELKT